MKLTAISVAIVQLQCEQQARSHRVGLVREIDGTARSAAWRLFASAGQRPTDPPIGSFSGWSVEGNSTPDASLVAGFSNWLTVDGQRENPRFVHYGNRSERGA